MEDELRAAKVTIEQQKKEVDRKEKEEVEGCSQKRDRFKEEIGGRERGTTKGRAGAEEIYQEARVKRRDQKRLR